MRRGARGFCLLAIAGVTLVVTPPSLAAPTAMRADSTILGTDCTQFRVIVNWNSAPFTGQDHMLYFIVDRRTAQFRSATFSVASGDTTKVVELSNFLAALERGKHRIDVEVSLRNAANQTLTTDTVVKSFPCSVSP
jgi:hypothetical protein